MRLFIAINFDDEIKDRILEIQSRLRAGSFQGNFSREQNLHLTLAFLGELEEEQLPAVKSAINSVSWEAFEVEFSRLGYFKRDGGDLWWIGLERTPQLMALQRELSMELEKRGFALEHKEFKPHLTLARQVVSERSMELHIQPFGAKVSEISLMKSERFSTQLAYVEMYRRRCHASKGVSQ